MSIITESAHSRQAMIESQLLTGEVIAPEVIAAFTKVPRDLFVPEKYKNAAYVDEDMEVSFGRYLLEPLTLGRMFILADIKPTDTVLDIGCASGYSSAIASNLAQKVIALEEVRDLAEKARKNLAYIGCSNVEVLSSSLQEGCHAKGPYQVILIQGAVEYIPSGLQEQLAEGGKLVTVENIMKRSDSTGGLGRLIVYTKVNNELFATRMFDASVPVLAAFQKKNGFDF
jgi:protein-L-isoaspartate(D-aspartate) O-methyltransferase